MPNGWTEEISYFTMDEFSSKIRENGGISVVGSSAINEKYNTDGFCPIDGEIIRGCDHLSAFLEGVLSIKNGVAANSLLEGIYNLKEAYKDKNIAGIDFSKYFDTKIY